MSSSKKVVMWRGVMLATLIVVWALTAILLVRMHDEGEEPLPKPVAFTKIFPAGTEIVPSDRIHPGTFKIDVSMDDLCSQRVAYIGKPLGTCSLINRDSPGVVQVRCWASRGDGTFYYAHDWLQNPWRGTQFGVATICWENGIIRLMPGRVVTAIDLIGVVLLTISLCAVLTLLSAGFRMMISKFRWKKKEKNLTPNIS